MTVVHQHPHPLAMQIVSPINPEILRTYGMVRVEDWDDRVSGLTWHEKKARGTFPEIPTYETSLDVGVLLATNIVRCHSTTTGAMVLLHDSWLPTPTEQG